MDTLIVLAADGSKPHRPVEGNVCCDSTGRGNTRSHRDLFKTHLSLKIQTQLIKSTYKETQIAFSPLTKERRVLFQMYLMTSLYSFRSDIGR